MKRIGTGRRGALVAAVSVATLGLAGGIAYATIPGSGNVYNACMLKGIGTIRLIDKALPSANLMSHCVDGKELEVSWNQAGQAGTPGSKGPDGDKGDAGQPGPPGPAGALASLDSINGLACTRNGQAGTAQVGYDANGVATIRCVTAGGGGTGGLPLDGVNNSCNIPVSLGSLPPGVSMTRIGTTAPEGTEDWFQVQFGAGGPLHLALTGDPGIKFDIFAICGTPTQLGVLSAQVSSPSPFLIRVYGDAGVTGSWTLAVSNPG